LARREILFGGLQRLTDQCRFVVVQADGFALGQCLFGSLDDAAHVRQFRLRQGFVAPADELGLPAAGTECRETELVL
jgi:hypothetical protein